MLNEKNSHYNGNVGRRRDEETVTKAKCVTSPSGLVMNSILNLQTELNMLHETTSVLESKLEPILLPLSPDDAKLNSHPSTGISLLDSLNTIHESNITLNGRLISILERLSL